MLPSGRARLFARPMFGAPPLNTIGMVEVSGRTAATAGDSTGTMMSGLLSTKARASASRLPSAPTMRRADDLGARAEQVHAGRVLALEDHEHEQPAREQAEADQRQRDVAADLAARRADAARRFLELGPDLQQRRSR